MTNAKKKLAAIAAAGLLLCLAGCQGPASGGEPDSAGKAVSEETTAASAVPGTDSSSDVKDVRAADIISIQADDGYTFDGRLCLPNGDAPPEKLVIYVNGSGPNTYENHRESGELAFNYFDLFADELTARGIAFFSYNTRGVTLGTEAPYFAEIDEEAYQGYVPANEIKDVNAIVRQLKKNPQLADAQVLLLGWSEGTIIAPNAALEPENQIDGLLLAGYCNDTMADILEWQQTGGSSMVFYRQYFDYDGDGAVSPEEFEEDRYQLKAQLGDVEFSQLDQTGDGKLKEDDFAILLKENRDQVFQAFDGGDDQWLKENYGVRLTSAWFQGHRELAPNSETLPKLDIPIYIFHGEYDANCDVQGVYEIEKTFQELGKSNLKAQVFPGGDHDLNYTQYVVNGTIPDGIAAIFQACQDF